MMYQSKLALAVKANSRVLREFEDAVYIPFGSEYSLLIKNLNTVKALVSISIDGTDVTDGTKLVVYPNSSIDLERFIKNGNMNAGNKFKFIERTEAISDHRGNKIDDGLIRVEFEFEAPRKVYPPVIFPSGTFDTLVNNQTFGDAVAKDWVSREDSPRGVQASATSFNGSVGSPMRTLTKSSAGGQSMSVPQADVGITVEGAVSNQRFHEVPDFPTDGVKHVMVMRILGEVEGKQVVEAVTVKTKAKCPSCGKENKANAKFCDQCGTGLQIV